MIILTPYTPKVLLPVPIREWRTPSQAQPKDQFGNENRTRFRLRARLNDGHIAWCGWFDSRDDVDAFLWAMVTGSLLHEPALWRLPTPWWDPDWSDLTYDFATLTFLTSPTGSTQTGTSPSDWNNSDNSVETVGAGASGGASGTDVHATGGGAGAWNKITNFSFATPGTTQYKWLVSAGGTGVAVGAAASSGNDGGGDTWFGNTSATNLATSSVGSKFGIHGVAAAGNQSGGAGGVGSSGVGTSNASGGRGGNLTGASGDGGSGGGAAGGPAGVGGNAGDSTSTGNNVTTAGGNVTSGATGGAGGSAATDGGSGTEYDGTHGIGAGGGGTSSNGSGRAGGAGGNYGGGGGGCNCAATSTSGAGKQGIVVLTYTPVTSLTRSFAMFMG